MAGEESVKVAKNPMDPPTDGAIVRFYRIGHGDCFLIAFRPHGSEKPIFVLIDCGRKKGSNKQLKMQTNPKEVAADIIDTTGGELDIAVLTHEHDDHLNGITEKNFAGLRIKELWLAWTESETDPTAIKLKIEKGKKVRALAAASQGFAKIRGFSAGEKLRKDFINELLELETGIPFKKILGMKGEGDGFGSNKAALHSFRSKAGIVRYLSPHEKPRNLAGKDSVKAFVLGPPKKTEQLIDENPDPEHAFPDGKGKIHPANFSSAIMRRFGDHEQDKACKSTSSSGPFAKAHSVPLNEALNSRYPGRYFSDRYGQYSPRKHGILNWRRIDHDWLDSAGNLALQLNTGTNNTSLVIAFELTPGGKVLLFAADAQAGNWLSWNDARFPSGGEKDKPIWPKELLKRTVLYKVGHHGSHNATLKGNPDDKWPNLSWLGQGEHAGEFTAMITAVRTWALDQKPVWDHPLPAIEDALMNKAAGKVFRTDKPPEMEAWAKPETRPTISGLFYDLRIEAN